MKLNNFRKYIFGNILSILGYIALWFLFYYILIIIPDRAAYYHLNGINPKDDLLSGAEFAAFYLYHFGIVLLIAILALIEFFIRKFLRHKKIHINLFEKITIPNVINKIYSILFWIGIILSPFFLYLFAGTFLLFFFMSFFRFS